MKGGWAGKILFVKGGWVRKIVYVKGGLLFRIVVIILLKKCKNLILYLPCTFQMFMCFRFNFVSDVVFFELIRHWMCYVVVVRCKLACPERRS